jgi:hypothetical protein
MSFAMCVASQMLLIFQTGLLADEQSASIAAVPSAQVHANFAEPPCESTAVGERTKNLLTFPCERVRMHFFVKPIKDDVAQAWLQNYFSIRAHVVKSVGGQTSQARPYRNAVIEQSGYGIGGTAAIAHVKAQSTALAINEEHCGE